MNDKDDLVLEQLENFLGFTITSHAQITVIDPVAIQKAIAIQKAQARVIDGVRKQDHRGCDCDVCATLGALDEVKK